MAYKYNYAYDGGFRDKRYLQFKDVMQKSNVPTTRAPVKEEHFYDAITGKN